MLIICGYGECVRHRFRVDGAETEKAHVEKLLVMPYGLARRFVLEEHKDLDGR